MLLNLKQLFVLFAFLPTHAHTFSIDPKKQIVPIVETSRRQSIETVAKGTLLPFVLSFVRPAFANEINKKNEIGTFEHPIAIIGGGGRTGMAVAESLATDGVGEMNGVIMTRSSKDPFKIIKLPPSTKNRLSFYDGSVDVRDYDSILTAFKQTKPSVVVFAASASKQGGNSFQVDGLGASNVARACKSVGAKLILISALAVDRPDSRSFQVTNTIGGYLDKIMDAKLQGEKNVKDIMGIDGYTIIRPGVLLNGKTTKGANGIELNQGDTIGGGISRDELAGVVVGALQNGIQGVTVEVYRKSTATKLQPEFAVPSGNELTASAYKDLFNNAKKDI